MAKQSCELCGKQTDLLLCEIESVRLNVCLKCSSAGKVLSSPAKPNSLLFQQRRISKQQERESKEEKEQVRRDFAHIILAERNKRKMNQKEFAHLLLEKQSVLMQYEHGRVKPGIENARRIEKILGILLVETVSQESEFALAKPQNNEMTIGDIIKVKQKEKK